MNHLWLSLCLITQVKQLAEKARAGKLAPNEFQGGTFRQSGILAVGRGNKVVEPVLDSDGTEKAAAVTKMSLTLSADHRVFDGQVGGIDIHLFTMYLISPLFPILLTLLLCTWEQASSSELASNFSDIRRLLL
ncbi:hypothetical protein PR202_ga13873 [Eleusine coracana subsp. coracana]|uniref:2-oxoacid dehydrogenase acyltransferase catalytic domain-containing protein n=1 Tax=Eleusine coracana subsp. coracana TaxID=191504 RepID=A0AAV5CFU2_ELECO|nr:hypothetical protein PR202_ga13873 [Eleusine coracana subsp. coracana]